MFGRYSDRSRRIIFLSRKIAGRRGSHEIGVEDMIEALVVEDQGEFASFLFARERSAGAAVQVLPEHRSFFTAETAAKIRRGLKPLLQPNGRPLPDSVDMHLSAASKEVLSAAQALRNELRHKSETPTHMGFWHVEPLHLLAAALSDDSSEVARLLKQAAVSREAVIAAIRRCEYSK